MALSPGLKLGIYEITAAIGAGGMGEVYRATDTKLGRSVAIKILPGDFASDADRSARFEREARLLASLNHPHIAALYGLHEADGRHFMVMELVEGETLADRIARGRIPIDEALSLAVQIADALDAAHERGVIHRDLKPANIKVTPSGSVKVLDFGLAKLADPSNGPGDTTGAPTMMNSMPGVLLGTPAYMAPEQATRQTVDRLADIWAFGCVLFEMLAGQRVFSGASGDVIGEILRSEPDWIRLPPDTPEGIRRLLRRCLRKDRNLRLHHIADALIEIDDVLSGASPMVSPPARSRRKQLLLWTLATALVASAAGAVAAWMYRRTPAAPEMRLEVAAEATTDPLSLAVSPDGRAIVYAASADGHARLWLRSMDAATARPLPSTDGGYYPFWSPDGRSLGFFADGKLKRLDIDTGTVQTLAVATAGRGGTWNGDGVIVFAPQAGPLYRIPAAGGEGVELRHLEADKGSKRFPQFLPDGRHFLYLIRDSSAGTKGVYVSQLSESGTRRLADADTSGVYATTGHLLFTRQGALFAQKFDVDALQVNGTAVALASGVAVNTQVGIGAVSSGGGVIAYRTGAADAGRRLAWFDRTGREIEVAPSPDRISDWGPSMSPDGRRVALTRIVDRNEDVWILDTDRGVPKRVTFDAARDTGPIWSPDGARIVFVSTRTGGGELFQKAPDGTENDVPLQSSAGASLPSDWSMDGRFLLYRTQDARTRYNIWALPLAGDRKAFPVVQTTFNERDAQFSPDGKWIAYESDESGQFEVYVRPFPGPGAAVPISIGGGAQVRWSRDGTELFYIALDDRLMSVSIRIDPTRQSVVASATRPLFMTHVGGAVNVARQQYAVTRDGQRFVMNVVEPRATPIALLLNWRGH